MSIDSNDVDRAHEIYGEIKDLLSELHSIFRKENGMTYERFRSYPYAHILIAMDDDHDYLGKNTFTVKELIDDLDNEEDEEDSDDSGLPGDSLGFPKD